MRDKRSQLVYRDGRLYLRTEGLDVEVTVPSWLTAKVPVTFVIRFEAPPDPDESVPPYLGEDDYGSE